MGVVNRGAEISTDLLARALTADHQVLVLHAGKLTPASYESHRIVAPPPVLPYEPKNLLDKALHRLFLDRYSRYLSTFTRQALSPLRAFKPDVIIPVNGPPQIKVLQSALPHTPLVVFGRAGIGWHDQANLKLAPSLFIALTPEAKTWAMALAPPTTKVVYLPNPIDPNQFHTDKKYPLDLTPPIVLSVAALSPYKNLDITIRAVAATSASLVIVGQEESDTAVLHQLADRLVPHRHLFLTLQPQDMPSVYQAASVFCLVSGSQEAFGRVYLEAMAAGLPIVATDDPARRRLIGPHGHFADPLHLDTLIQALQQALNLTKIDYTANLRPYVLSSVVSRLNQLLRPLSTAHG